MKKSAVTAADETLKTLTVDIQSELIRLEVRKQDFETANTKSYIKIGKWLKQAKAIVPYKQWQIWLNENFKEKITRQTALNYINVAEKVGNCQNVLTVEEFQFAALIELVKLSPAELQNFLIENPTAQKFSVRQLKSAIQNFKNPTLAPVNKSVPTLAQVKNFLDAQKKAGVDLSATTSKDLIPATKDFYTTIEVDAAKAITPVEVQTFQLPLFKELPALPSPKKMWLVPAPLLDTAARAGVEIYIDFSRNARPIANGILITKQKFEIESTLSKSAVSVISTLPMLFIRTDGKTVKCRCYIWFFGGADFQPFTIFGNLFYTPKKSFCSTALF